jgi:hypothetical protein
MQTILTMQTDTAGTCSASTSPRPPTSAFTASLVALLDEHAGTWSGSAAELHELLPGHAADAVRLAKTLTRAADELTAAGITIERKRQAGTGARILVLTCQVDQPAAVTVDAPASVVTVEGGRAAVTIRQAAPTPTQPNRPLLACPICRGSDWGWHQSNRRRASRWLCSTCNPQP